MSIIARTDPLSLKELERLDSTNFNYLDPTITVRKVEVKPIDWEIEDESKSWIRRETTGHYEITRKRKE